MSSAIIGLVATLTLTDEHRSLICSAIISGMENQRFSLCCGPRAMANCAAIVGEEFAGALQAYAYGDLGCMGSGERTRNPQSLDYWLERYLEKIAELKALHWPALEP